MALHQPIEVLNDEGAYYLVKEDCTAVQAPVQGRRGAAARVVVQPGLNHFRRFEKCRERACAHNELS